MARRPWTAALTIRRSSVSPFTSVDTLASVMLPRQRLESSGRETPEGARSPSFRVEGGCRAKQTDCDAAAAGSPPIKHTADLADTGACAASLPNNTWLLLLVDSSAAEPAPAPAAFCQWLVLATREGALVAARSSSSFCLQTWWQALPERLATSLTLWRQALLDKQPASQRLPPCPRQKSACGSHDM
jgi:hypothetical protein